jgi:PAS domain S-box-containing protein
MADHPPGHAAQRPDGESKGAEQSPEPPFAYAPHEEEHFALLVNGVTEYAIFMLDPHGLITNWNTGAERIKGYRADEIIGKHFSIFYTEADRQADVPGHALRTALQKGMYESQAWRVRKDGTRFMANVVIQPLRNPAGHLLGFAKLTRDVSEPFHQRRALEEAKAALARSQKLAVFGPLSDIAHDLNNLLQVIRNSAELLRRRVELDAEAGSLVDMVRRNTESAANLTRQLMVLARARPAEPCAIDVNELVAGMAELLRQLLGESVTIETVLGDLGWVSADADQLKVAILNVVVNARNALPHGGKLTVRTENFDAPGDMRARGDEDGVPPGQYVTIAVSDSGPGMTSEIIAKALDTSASLGAESATQLGMSQVYGFVNQVGGHLRIESAPATGTTVKIYLPRLPQESAADVVTTLPEESGAQGTPSGEPRREDPLAGLRVLIVEDESLVALLIEDLVEQLGCTVAGVVANVRNALEMAMTEIDLALLDISVGGQSVFPVAQALQSRGVPFVFMSGYSQLDEPWRGRPIVQKPFDIEQLRREIERAVRGT